MTLIQLLIPRAVRSTRILWKFLDTKFIGLGFATAEPSPEVPSCTLFDMALCFLFEREWLQ